MSEGQETSGDTVQEMEGPSGLEGEPSTRQVLATLTKCIEKMSSKPDTRIGQDLPKWTDAQDQERFFALFEFVMEDYDIPTLDWIKQLKPTIQGRAQTEWASYHLQTKGAIAE